MARVFGEVSGYPVGTTFKSYAEMNIAGVHRAVNAGIVGGADEGAESIVLNGGYEDDEDFGDVIIYTGAYGRDPSTQLQIADQEFVGWNQALVVNSLEGLSVRVIRGRRAKSDYRPATGYRYDGLYRVEDFGRKRGKSGFYICWYRLVRDAGPASDGTSLPAELPQGPAARTESTIQRIVRSTPTAARVKELYDHACQVCGLRILTAEGDPYAEGAHVRPLGRPHDGPDTASNILCLCPNDHVRFDRGAIAIEDDLTIRDRVSGLPIGRLLVVDGHPIDREQLRYQRNRW